jgi:NADP-dependent 3-hydroxy acid dehydrogenase YdfG
MASRIYAVIAGVGPGTGAAVARKFAKTYPVVLLARKAESYDPLVSEIDVTGGSAVGIPTGVGNADSVKEAFKTIDEKFGNDASCAVRTPKLYVNFFSCQFRFSLLP